MESILTIALRISIEAHSNQEDKSGSPYILHPFRLMLRFNTEKMRVIALLHDVLEDSNHTQEFLIDSGIPQEWVYIIKILTKRSYQSYEEYIKDISHNELATLIKIADLEDNMNILRLNILEDKDIERIKKYHKAWKLLSSPSQVVKCNCSYAGGCYECD
jgi:(p)ppGpp synthase/HD superfamily hydrolase